MWRAIALTILAATLLGCSPSSSDDFGFSALRQDENQTRHYRPVHPQHENWVIDRLGSTFTLKGGDERIKVSMRDDSAVIRRSGIIVGKIVRDDDLFSYVSVDDRTPTDTLHVRCHKNRADVISDHSVDVFRSQHDGIEGRFVKIRKLTQKNKYSVVTKTSNSDMCEGIPVESFTSAHANGHGCFRNETRFVLPLYANFLPPPRLASIPRGRLRQNSKTNAPPRLRSLLAGDFVKIRKLTPCHDCVHSSRATSSKFEN